MRRDALVSRDGISLGAPESYTPRQQGLVSLHSEHPDMDGTEYISHNCQLLVFRVAYLALSAYWSARGLRMVDHDGENLF